MVGHRLNRDSVWYIFNAPAKSWLFKRMKTIELQVCSIAVHLILNFVNQFLMLQQLTSQ